MAYFFTVDLKNTAASTRENVLAPTKESLKTNVTDKETERGPSHLRTVASYDALHELCQKIIKAGKEPDTSNPGQRDIVKPINDKAPYAVGVYEDWRTIMSMIALNKINNYDIEFTPINLSKDANTTLCKIIGLENERLDSYRSIGEDYRNDILPNADWANSYFIKIKNIASSDNPHILGVTHPRLLILPSKNLKATLERVGKNPPDISNIFENIGNVGKWIYSIRKFIGEQGKADSVAYWLCDRLYKELSFSYDNCKTQQNMLNIPLFGDATQILLDTEYDIISETELTGLFNCLNKTMKHIIKIPPQQWRNFFACFALNDIMDFKIAYNKNDGIFTKDGHSFAKADPKHLFYFVDGGKYDLPYKNDDEFKNDIFSNVCLYNWLKQLKTYCKSNTREDLDLTNFITIVQDVMEEVKANINDTRGLDSGTTIEQMGLNFFKAANASHLAHPNDNNPFHMPIHKRRALFIHGDNSSELCKTVRKGWLDMLSLWALNDIRNLGLNFDGMAGESIARTIDPENCIYKAAGNDNYTNYKLMQQNKELADTSTVLLLELCNDKTGTIADMEAHISKQFNDLKVFAHEKLLVAAWFRKLLDNLDGDLFLNNGELKKIKGVIEGRIMDLIDEARNDIEEPNKKDPKNARTLQSTSATITSDLETASLWGDNGLYASSDITGKPNSIVQHIPSCIEDKIFEKYLMLIDYGDSEVANRDKLKNTFDNDKYKEASIYSVYTDDIPPLLSEASILLPFKDTFLNKLDDNYKVANVTALTKNNANRIKAFQIDTIETHEEGSDYIVTITGQNKVNAFLGSLIIKKRYSKGYWDEKSDEDDNPIGTAAVWPDVEIEGFTGYKLNYVTKTENTEAGKMSVVGDTLQGTESDPIRLNASKEAGDQVYFSKVSYEGLSIFPKFIRFSFESTKLHSDNSINGVILNLPNNFIRHISSDGGAINNATIGIDFGTSNSLIYIDIAGLPGYPKALQWTEDKGKVLTNNLQKLGHTAQMFFRLPKHDPIGDTETFPSICVEYPGEISGQEPFIHGNIVLMPATQMDSNVDKVIDSRSCKKDMKWSPEDLNARMIFLKQMLASAYVTIVRKAEMTVKSVSIRISYPSVFRKEMLHEFKNTCTSILQQLNVNIQQKTIGDTGKVLGYPEGTAHFITESYCAAHLTASDIQSSGSSTNRRADFNRGVMVVDVGGGSLDIAIFKDITEPKLHLDNTPVYDNRGIPEEITTRKIIFEHSIEIGARKILGNAFFGSGKRDEITRKKHRESEHGITVNPLADALFTLYKSILNAAESKLNSEVDITRKKVISDLFVEKDKGEEDKKQIPKTIVDKSNTIEPVYSGFASGVTFGSALMLSNLNALRSLRESKKIEFIFNLERIFKCYSIATKEFNVHGKTIGSIISKTMKGQTNITDPINPTLNILYKIELACAAIFYFLGSIARSLQNEPEYASYNVDIQQIILAGNGSGVFDWIDTGIVEKFYMKGFTKNTTASSENQEIQEDIALLQTIKRKHEVATGLVKIPDAIKAEELSKQANRLLPLSPDTTLDDIKEELRSFLEAFYELSCKDNRNEQNGKDVFRNLFAADPKLTAMKGNPFSGALNELDKVASDFIKDQYDEATEDKSHRNLDIKQPENITLAFALNMLGEGSGNDR